MNFEKNLTTNFLLPCLGITRTYLNMHNFQEAYLFDCNREILDNCLYLKFKPEKLSADYQDFEKKILESGKVLDVYDLDEDEVVFAIQVNKEYHDDLNKFMNGEYSQFSRKFKNKMNYPDQYLVRGICDKEEFARQAMSSYYDVNIPKNQEYCAKPNLKKEILNYSENE
jgi:hypothetical protein